ncbi:BREX-4 system phosphatase PglZ [Acutalibacter muris]|jgi:hypothetical protein|uniref:BREX-4 system phosphatase PglZ n=1 Tax=Acutalibacter muris TaxID=1796620 RepID=UPI0026357DD3|nr:BREX-4 system phosphatase PglZ [Acutalibacter muris]
MKRFASIQNVKQEIDSYEEHFTGAPLVVGIDGGYNYTALLSLLKDDYGKQVIRMSDSCSVDFPPDPAFQISLVSNSAKAKPVIWIGAAQAKMLYGQQPTEQFLVNLLGTCFSGPVTVICPFCCTILEGIARNYAKLGYNAIVMSDGERNIPAIHVVPENVAYPGADSVQGIKELLRILENGKYGTDIYLTTSCKVVYLERSMYPVSEGMNPYQVLCRLDSGIAANTQERNGTSEQWQKLLLNLQKAKSLSDLCVDRICEIQNLADEFGDHLAGNSDDRFLCFICLKAFYSNRNDYLAYCLQKSQDMDSLERCIYNAILDIDYQDKHFSTWMRQRRRMLSTLDDNSAMMKDYCNQATIKCKDILWYISDETEEERAALIHALCSYSYLPDELNQILAVVSPQLAAYLHPFIFDEFNTKVMESDAYVRGMLTDYFQHYKFQKITNRQDDDFVELVEKEAKIRSFTKLQARSAVVKKLDKKDARPYFFDALGVEFLAFIESRAEAYKMQFECFVGRCNLPSITSKNKDFYNAFPEGSVRKEEGLDELKHQGTKYDFQFTTEPLHVFDELAILDRDLKKMGSMLAMGQCQKIIILSDHGASRLAVTYRSENSKLELSEPGQHSGRCCPAEKDPGIEFATFEDGFAVLANYERFKGSRKADVETHGGASLEETVVPVIVLTAKPEEQQVFFVETSVLCSPREGSRIRMFANPSLKKPRLVVNGQSYDGKFDGDKHNVIFDMPDIRRKGHYEAEIYNGGIKVAVLTFETKRQTGTKQLL